MRPRRQDADPAVPIEAAILIDLGPFRFQAAQQLEVGETTVYNSKSKI